MLTFYCILRKNPFKQTMQILIRLCICDTNLGLHYLPVPNTAPSLEKVNQISVQSSILVLVANSKPHIFTDYLNHK